MSRQAASLIDFRPPSLRLLQSALAFQRWYFAPTLSGEEHVNPERPALFVGNHAMYGIVDSPLFVSELYRRTGVFPRSLGDHFHFVTPGWGRLLERFGAVPGTPENCRTLMNHGQHILVFPGGAREVAKRRDEINRLVWKQRTGFARMAITHGYDIIPFASVGCDESWRILYDGHDFRASRLGRWLLSHEAMAKKLRDGDLFMPLAKGVGPTLMPRPEPFHFRIGAPISTAALQGQEQDPAVQWQVREQVADSINSMIATLAQARAAERPSLSRWRRWLLRDQ
jgi:1-acyl-sn-glycerol-3-phosphate acyltransferase